MEQALRETRARTLALVAHLPDAELERQVDPIMSPLVWDLAHIAAYEDLWLVHRHGGEPLLRPDLAALYDAFETPRAVRGEIELLDARRRPRLPRRRARATRWPSPTRDGIDPVLHEMVLRHELQHTRDDAPGDGRSAALLPPGEPRARPPLGGRRRLGAVPAGPFAMGAGAEGFAYDNERPRHRVELRRLPDRPPPGDERRVAALRRGRRLRAPRVVDGRGLGVEGGATTSRDCPGCAATGTRTPPRATSPGSRPTPSPARTARACRPRRSGRRRRPGASTDGGAALRASARSGSGRRRRSAATPGFVAHPYREYSEVFFGDGYRVLRGGSWATAPAGRHPDVPQLGPPAAPADLRRRAAGPRRGGLTWSRCGRRAVRVETYLGPGGRALARRRRPRRPDAPVQGAAARSTSTTPAARSSSTASPSCPSTTRRAPSGRSSITDAGRDRRAHRRRRSSSSSARGPRRRRGSCCARCTTPGTLRRYVPIDVTEAMVRATADDARRGATRASSVHGIVGDFERHLDGVPPPAAGPRIVAFLGGTIGNFTPGSRRRFLRAMRAAAAPRRRPPAARHRPRQGPGGARGRLQRRGGRHGRVQPQRPARGQPRARRGLRRRAPSSTSRSSTASASGSRCACARSARMHVHVGAARPRRRVRRARGAAHRDQREVHARAAAGRPRRGRPASSCAVLTDPDGLFALSLSAPPPR